MEDAEQQQPMPCDASKSQVQPTALAVSELFREHNRMLVGYLRSRLGSEQEAKEVAQEAYVRVLQLHQPGAPGLLRAYLFKTAANLAVDRLRHRRVRQRSEEQPQLFEELNTAGAELDDPATQLLAREQAEQLLRFLQELPTKSQQVMNLHRFEGMAQRDVALRLGISERMVRRHLTYAMVYCQLRLEGMNLHQVRQKVSL